MLFPNERIFPLVFGSYFMSKKDVSLHGKAQKLSEIKVPLKIEINILSSMKKAKDNPQIYTNHN